MPERRFVVVVMALATAGLAATAAGAGDAACPPPPDDTCARPVPRTTLQELDADMDGAPDNVGSTGCFCDDAASSACVDLSAPVVAFDLIVADPALQSVTCSVADGGPLSFLTITAGADCSDCLVIEADTVTLPAGSTTETSLTVSFWDASFTVCPSGVDVTCTFDVEVLCDDLADGDGDGLVDDADPDCCVDGDGDGACDDEDCDDTNAAVQGPPTAVEDFRVATGGFDTTLEWALRFDEWTDVASGPLADLRGTGDFGLAACLVEDALSAPVVDPRPDPLPGEGYYYAARAQNTCEAGGYGPPGGPPRTALGQLAPCGYDPACTDCAICLLHDPTPVCGDDVHCLRTVGFPPTVCFGDAGTGGQGAACESFVDCLPGFTCEQGFLFACARWCRTQFQDCPVGSCVPRSPRVIVDETEYGICVE